MVLERKELSELSKQQMRMVEVATSAMSQHNYSYVCDMLRNLLLITPGCVELRLMLRRAQKEAAGPNVSIIAKAIAGVKNFNALFVKGPSLLKSGKLAEALDVGEQAMEADPSSKTAASFLARCALAGGLPEIAVNVYQTSLDYNPNHIPTMKKLADVYARTEDVMNELQIRQQIASLQPDNLALQNELKQVSARAAMSQGKWENAGSFRDLVKDKDLARSLEQRERLAARDEDTLQEMIKDAEKAVEAQPTAAQHKRLAELYQQNKQYDEALEQYDKVVEVSGVLDPTINAAITNVIVKRFNEAIEQWQLYGKQDDEKRAEAEEQIAIIKQQREDVIFERLQQRVERYPSDAVARFELGEAFFAREQYDDAIREFQYGQRNPQFKRRSIVYIGKCMMSKGMTDMAIEQFENALQQSEEGRTDKVKKDIMYNLALIHSESGNDEEAFKYLKELYSEDVNYRDVAQRLEDYYKKNKKQT